MPNLLDDGFLDQAYFVRIVSQTPSNLDYQLGNAINAAVSNAAIQGLFSCTVNVSPYSANNYYLPQLYVQRLVNMGYTASLSTNTLTISWN